MYLEAEFQKLLNLFVHIIFVCLYLSIFLVNIEFVWNRFLIFPSDYFPFCKGYRDRLYLEDESISPLPSLEILIGAYQG